MTPLVEVQGLRKYYPVHRGVLRRSTAEIRAVDGVDLAIREGECLAIVGESGSGKTTLGRCIVRLIETTSGTIRFAGEDLLALSAGELRERRQQFQMVFQDPISSLNPRRRVGSTLEEPLEIHDVVPANARQARVEELLELVGMSGGSATRYPHEFSGGQRQRIGIARALASQPRFLVADEPVSALDLSVRAQIVNLLADLQTRLQLTVLLIAHDLAVVEQISDRVAVMYRGEIVESAATDRLYDAPQHPYTVSLLSAVPIADPLARKGRIVLAEEPPSPTDLLDGCRFHPRCPIAQARCRQEAPGLSDNGEGHAVACHYPGELDPALPAGG